MLRLGHKTLEIPLIQGGMGIAISLSGLAGAVMKEGGMGVISAAQPGFRMEGFDRDPAGKNLEAIAREAEKARTIAGSRGLLGLNIMHAGTHYAQYCRQAEASGYDAILSGAGLALELPAYVSDDILLAPIVSSLRALQLIVKTWHRRYSRMPDFVVVEGSEAGGHLGFSREMLDQGSCPDLSGIVQEIKDQFPEIPLFAAGGIFDGADVRRIMAAGADGVQVATRLIATWECDAPQVFKDLLIRAGKEDIMLLDSPAGFPARALKTPFSLQLDDSLERNKAEMVCTNCLKTCSHQTAPYCLSHALMKAAEGDEAQGLFFTGSSAWKICGMQSVKEVVRDLMNE